MRTISLTGCLWLVASIASAQTPAIRTTDGAIGAAGLGGTKSITPGSLLSIYGSSLAATLAQADSTTLSASLADVDSVTIGGIRARLQFVVGTQINAQVPWSVPAGQANVVVTRAGVASQPYTAQVTAQAPAVYGFNPSPQAVSVNPDGTITGPAGNVLGLSSRPAAAGEGIFFYASGLGAVDQPPPPDGVNSIDALRRTANPLTVKLGGVQARVDFAGLSPQFTGVYQVNITIPSGVTPGAAVPMQLTIGGVDSPDQSTIALR